jgi:hypothetical protein
MRLSESLQFIPLIKSADVGGAGVDTDVFNAGLLNGVSLVFTFGAITGNSTLIGYKGATAALAAAKGTAMTFRYRHAAADTGSTLADTLGDATAVATTGLTLTAATYDNKQLVVELDPDEIAGYPYVCFAISATANPMNVACVAVGAPRYPGHTHPTTL